jgi:hypothetical protein
MRSDESFRNSGSLHKVEIAWNTRNQPLVSNNVLGLAAATHKSEDSVSWLERADNIRSEGIDLTSVFEARDVSGKSRRGWIDAIALQQISPIEAASSNADPDLLASGLGYRHVADFQDLRAAFSGDDVGFHCSAWSKVKGGGLVPDPAEAAGSQWNSGRATAA